jgi:hypothetical protein
VADCPEPFPAHLPTLRNWPVDRDQLAREDGFRPEIGGVKRSDVSLIRGDDLAQVPRVIGTT